MVLLQRAEEDPQRRVSVSNHVCEGIRFWSVHDQDTCDRGEGKGSYVLPSHKRGIMTCGCENISMISQDIPMDRQTDGRTEVI